MTEGVAPNPLAVATVRALAEHGWTLATAESLTAGLLASTIAEVPGASAVLRGGLIVYATDLKSALADVPEDVLDRYGAVSPETARALAEGAALRCEADVGIGLTGVAGPDTQEGHAVGTVFLGLCSPGTTTFSVGLSLSGDRPEIRSAACTEALRMLAKIASKKVSAATGNESGPLSVIPRDAEHPDDNLAPPRSTS